MTKEQHDELIELCKIKHLKVTSLNSPTDNIYRLIVKIPGVQSLISAHYPYLKDLIINYQLITERPKQNHLK